MPESPAGIAAVTRWIPSPSRYSMFYIYIIAFVIFSIWIPKLWLSGTTFENLLNISFALPTIVALGLLLPLSVGAFDLSISGAMSLAGVVASKLMVIDGKPVWFSIVAALIACLVLGLINGILVEYVGISSFVATLGTGATATAVAIMVSNNRQIVGMPTSFVKLGSGEFLGHLQTQVLFAAVLALIVWYFLEHTRAGRYALAVGENPEAARLAGVPTRRYVMSMLVASSVIAGIAGLSATANLGAGDSTLGGPYLLNAFAVCFLGATQLVGRLNVLGLLVAGWVLDSGVQGITLGAQSYPWLNQFFFGVALIIAVGLSSSLERFRAYQAIRSRRRQLRAEPAAAGSGSALPGAASAPRATTTSGDR